MKRLSVLHRYYKITKFYDFLKKLAINAGIALLIFTFIAVILEYFFIDFDTLFNSITERFSPFYILLIYFISEATTTIIPPEIFIIWASKMSHPWLILFLLASISYLGGLIAYFIGKKLSEIKIIKTYLEEKIAQHITNLRKWGGLLIVIGATLPPPFALICMASGLIHYDLKKFLLYSLTRYLRFILYALILFKIF